MARRLTQRQRKVLTFIENYIREKGYSPSYRDIGENMVFSPSASKDHVLALVRKGYLEQRSGFPRAIKIPRCFLLLVTESVEVQAEIPAIQVGDYLTIRATSSAKVGDTVIMSQDPIVVKSFETGDVIFGKVVGFSRAID